MHRRIVVSLVVAIAFVAAGSLLGRVHFAYADTAAVAAQMKPVLNTYNLMEQFFDAPHTELIEGLESEPETGRAWRGLRNNAEVLAEASNLTLIRELKDESKRAEWTRIALEQRDEAEKLAGLLDERDYPGAKAQFRVLVQSCNQCHNLYPDVAPQLAWE